MSKPKNLDEKTKPGEQPPGKFHYNPGNMAGKTVNDATPPEGERTNDDTDPSPPSSASRKTKSQAP